ncbi:MAG TPA: 50S ribosomal protein L10 [Candidatus Paceibacterota bacterium]|nr:50S ribosomal protein L10 [Candidatus Paceibacterota bacterium]
MALLRSKKEEIVKGLGEAIDSSKSVVFVDFHGLNVTDETVLRRDLREKEVGYKVSRKSLLRRALEGKAEGELPPLTGEVALAYSNDPIASAREVYAFHKSHNGLLSILGGIFEGKFVDAEKMTEIATIPSREVLLSKIAFLLKSPMQRLAIAVGEVAKKK